MVGKGRKNNGRLGEGGRKKEREKERGIQVDTQELSIKTKKEGRKKIIFERITCPIILLRNTVSSRPDLLTAAPIE